MFLEGCKCGGDGRIFKRGRVSRLTVAVFVYKNGDTNDTVLFFSSFNACASRHFEFMKLYTACKITVYIRAVHARDK